MLLIRADRSALSSIVSLISKAVVFCVSQCQQQIFRVLKSSLVWLAEWGFHVYSREYLLPFSEVERTHIVTACSWKEPIPLIWALLHHKLLLAYFNALRSWLIVWPFFPGIVAEGPVWVHISLCRQRSDSWDHSFICSRRWSNSPWWFELRHVPYECCLLRHRLCNLRGRWL